MIDEVAAPIVRRIFRMTLEGYGPYQIAAQLSSEHIPVPAYHQAKGRFAEEIQSHVENRQTVDFTEQRNA